MEYTRGIIQAFLGSWDSGLGQLAVYGRKAVTLSPATMHEVILIPCQNAPTVRALEACFGDVITRAHTVNQEAIAGQDILYCTDDLGLLLAFVPTEQWGADGLEVPAVGESVELEEGGDDESPSN